MRRKNSDAALALMSEAPKPIHPGAIAGFIAWGSYLGMVALFIVGDRILLRSTFSAAPLLRDAVTLIGYALGCAGAVANMIALGFSLLPLTPRGKYRGRIVGGVIGCIPVIALFLIITYFFYRLSISPRGLTAG